MKNTIFFAMLLFPFLFSACEEEDDFPDHEAHIRFVNHTNMLFDSVVNEYSRIDNMHSYRQKFVNLHPGDTSEYQSGINMEGVLYIKACTPDTNYNNVWSYPISSVDPANIEDASFFDYGYYTFSLYNTDNQPDNLFVGLNHYQRIE